MHLDFKWLHTFVTAAKYENFRKTAETLFISADRHRSYKIIRERNQLQAVSAERPENTIDGRRKSIRAVCHETFGRL